MSESYLCFCGESFSDDYFRSVHTRSCKPAIGAIIDGRDFPLNEDKRDEKIRDYEAALEQYENMSVGCGDLKMVAREALAKWKK